MRILPTGRRAIGLQGLLTALPVLGVLPLLGFAALLMVVLAQRSGKDIERDLEQGTRALAVAIDRELAASARRLQLLAAAPALRAGDLAAFDDFARQALRLDARWRSLDLVDRQGTQLYDSARGEDEPLRTGALGAHHERVFDRGQPVVSDLLRGPADGRLSIEIAVPVPREQATGWALTARLAPDYLHKLLIEQPVRDDAIAMLLDSRQRILARSREPARFLGRLPDAGTLAALQDRPAGTGRIATPDGSRLLWSWRTLPSGWVVLLGVPHESYDTPLRASMLRLAAAGLFALALGIAGAYAVARLIALTVDRMARNAPLLLQGRLPDYRRSGVRQLDALYEALEAASRRLAEASRERAQSLEAERTARREAEQANRAKDEFLAMLSHELRNPLAPITNAHRLLARTEPLTERGLSMLSMAERQTRQMTRLVEDLLEVTRITRGKIVLQPARVRIEDAVRHSVQTVSAAAARRGQRIAVSVSPGAGSIVADEARIAQVLENLLGNAVKYTHPGGDIRIEAGGGDATVEIRVTDNGSGIGPEDLPRIFELFAQAEVTIDRSQGGLGIGLSLVRRLVEMHGGTVTAASPGKGRGATFTVRLPRRPATLEHPERAPA